MNVSMVGPVAQWIFLHLDTSLPSLARELQFPVVQPQYTLGDNRLALLAPPDRLALYKAARNGNGLYTANSVVVNAVNYTSPMRSDPVAAAAPVADVMPASRPALFAAAREAQRTV